MGEHQYTAMFRSLQKCYTEFRPLILKFSLRSRKGFPGFLYNIFVCLIPDYCNQDIHFKNVQCLVEHKINTVNNVFMAITLYTYYICFWWILCFCILAFSPTLLSWPAITSACWPELHSGIPCCLRSTQVSSLSKMWATKLHPETLTVLDQMCVLNWSSSSTVTDEISKAQKYTSTCRCTYWETACFSASCCSQHHVVPEGPAKFSTCTLLEIVLKYFNNGLVWSED